MTADAGNSNAIVLSRPAAAVPKQAKQRNVSTSMSRARLQRGTYTDGYTHPTITAPTTSAPLSRYTSTIVLYTTEIDEDHSACKPSFVVDSEAKVATA